MDLGSEIFSNFNETILIKLNYNIWPSWENLTNRPGDIVKESRADTIGDYVGLPIIKYDKTGVLSISLFIDGANHNNPENWEIHNTYKFINPPERKEFKKYFPYSARKKGLRTGGDSFSIFKFSVDAKRFMRSCIIARED